MILNYFINNLKMKCDLNYERVEQSVMFGSLFEAFYSGFVNTEDVLQYLLKREYKNDNERKKLCIAYRIVCMFDKEQIINKNQIIDIEKKNVEKEKKDFILLTENEDYLAIYILSFGSISINMNITQKLQKFYPKLQGNKYKKFYNKICENGEIFNEKDGFYVAKIRCLKKLNLCSYMDLLLEDYLDALENMNEKVFFNDLLNRCCFLRKIAPLYWENVAYNLYRPFVEKKYSNPIFPKNSLLLLCECFPNLYPDEIMNRSEVVQRLYGYTKIVSAYCLGFPIHEYIPSANKVDNVLKTLSNIGTNKYLESLEKKKYRENVKIVNTENVHYDKIDDFNDFDVINYYTDSKDSFHIIHLFRFTRPEFETILKDKKNFYTGEPLPFFVLEEIKSRINMAKEYKLPKAKTLSEFLKDEYDVPDLEVDLEDDENVELERENEELEDENVEIGENEELEDENEELENENDIYVVEDEEVEDFPFFVGRALSQEGEERFFRLRLIPELQTMNETDLENIVREIMESRGMRYLGRVECNCEQCESHMSI